MGVEKFRKKPVVIDAMLLDQHNAQEVVDWIVDGGHIASLNENGSVFIDTLEGMMYAPVGSYIIKGVAGEFYACEPNIFAQTYEAVE